MTPTPSAPLLAASHVQGMASKTGNEKLAFVLTGLSCLLVAKMVWDQFGFQGKEHLTHVQRLNMERLGRQLDERSMWPGDRRR